MTEDSGRGLRFHGGRLTSHRHAARFRWLAPWLQVVISVIWNLLADPLTRRWVAVGVGAVVVRWLLDFRPEALFGALIAVLAWMWWKLGGALEVVG